jgi:hypothetical protein
VFYSLFDDLAKLPLWGKTRAAIGATALAVGSVGRVLRGRPSRARVPSGVSSEKT